MKRDCLIRHKESDWDISNLAPFLSTNYFELVVKEGNALAKEKSLSTCRYYMSALFDFGSFLAKKPKGSNVPENLLAGISPPNSAGDWHHFLHGLSRHFLDQTTPRQAAKRSSAFNQWLKVFGARGMCPSGLKMQAIPKTKTQPAKTVLHTLPSLNNRASDVLRGLDIGSDTQHEAELICSSILAELGDVEIKTENLVDLIEAALEKRLSTLRKQLWSVFEAAVKKRHEGLALINAGLKYAPRIDSWLRFNGSFKQRDNKHLLDQVRDLSDDQFLAGLLAWFMKYSDMPGVHLVEGFAEPRILNRMNREVSMRRSNIRHGSDKFGANNYIAFMGASRDLLISGYLLILFETCGNPSSLADLETNSLQDVFNNLSVLDWTKSRAGKVLSHWESPADAEKNVKRVFEELCEATKYYRPHAHDADKDYLFLHVYPATSVAKHRRWAADFVSQKYNSASISSCAELLINRLTEGSWKAKPKAIRTSLIVLDAMKKGIKSAQGLAQHSTPATTVSYTNSLLFKLKLDQHMRVYIEWLEALVTVDIDDVAVKLGLDEAEFSKIRQSVLESQFGSVHCSDPNSGYQTGSVAGSPCTQVMMCMTCEKRRNIFIATKDNVANLLLWRDALKRAFESEVIKENDANWLLWRIYVDTMYDRLSRQLKHKALLVDVEQQVQDIQENPYAKVFFSSSQSVQGVA